MPRSRAIFPCALSATQAATALKLPLRIIHEAVYATAELPAYKQPNGSRVRILVSDLEQWVRLTWPRATIKRTISRSK